MMSSAHASTPVHCTSQNVAEPQSTFLSHERSPQRTRHGMFAGHVMSVAHVSLALQSITHTPAMQVPLLQPASHSASAAGVEASGAMPTHDVSGAAHQPSVEQT